MCRKSVRPNISVLGLALANRFQRPTTDCHPHSESTLRRCPLYTLVSLKPSLAEQVIEGVW
jgi:hypothetical protein